MGAALKLFLGGRGGADARGALFLCCLSFVRRVLSLSRESTKERPGESQKRRFPRTPSGFHAVGRAAAFGAALVAQACLNFRLTRKQALAKSPHGFFWRPRCSRWRLWERGRSPEMAYFTMTLLQSTFLPSALADTLPSLTCTSTRVRPLSRSMWAVSPSSL